MMDKFYAQHQFSRYKTARPVNLRRVFGAVELALDFYNVKGSNSPRAQKGAQKHNAYLPKFVNSLKNSPFIFPKIHPN